MTGFETVGCFIIGILTSLLYRAVNDLMATQKVASQRQAAINDLERQLSYARSHIENVTARNRRSMIGVRVIARSNNDDELLIGKVVGFAEITRANNPVPAVLEEATGKTLHTLGIVVPYSDELMEQLKAMSFKEQWDWMVKEKMGLRWE